MYHFCSNFSFLILDDGSTKTNREPKGGEKNENLFGVGQNKGWEMKVQDEK